MKFLTAVFLSLLSFIGGISDSFASEMKFSIINKNKIRIQQGNSRKTYSFFVSINGYSVNCQRTKMIVWGYPLKFNENSPSANGYVLFDLKNRKIIKSDLMFHGIFSATFFSDNIHAYIGSGMGYLINIKTGKEIETVSRNELDNVDNLSEKCAKPKSWMFERFPNG